MAARFFASVASFRPQPRSSHRQRCAHPRAERMAANNTIKTQTVHGPVIGFADTFPAGDRSSASRVLKGEDGGKPAVNKWLAIRYGKAERWARPQDPDSWTDPLECFEFGTSFPQPPSATAIIYYKPLGIPMRAWQEQSEDSFFVNVFAPGDAKPDEKLPVMVWVYGGSLTTGSTSSFIYDATEFVRHEASQGRRIIVVTGNYRVNIFGFLASQDLVETDPDGLAGNYGIYDVIKFLQWTQDNVQNFGGDPSNVTVFSESAGAYIVSNLLVHPAPLFRRAIMQSGSANTMTVRNVAASSPLYDTLLAQTGVSSSEASPSSRIEALRKIPAKRLLDVKAPPLAAYGLTLESGPKAMWSQHPGKSIKEGKARPGIEAVIVGYNQDEGSLFAKLLGLDTVRGYNGFVGMYPPALRPHLEAFYPPPTNEQPEADEDYTKGSGSRGFADGVFDVPMEHQADGLARNGKPVYAYKLEATVKEFAAKTKLGVGHAVDLLFLFRAGPASIPGSEEERVANAIGSAWSEFAIKGVPRADWPLWSEPNRALKVWNQDGSEGKAELGPVPPKSTRALWTGVIEKAIDL